MIHLSLQDFARIEKFVLDYSGIVVARLQQKSIRERIQKHMERLNLQTVEDYVLLLESPSSTLVRDELMSLVTVGESFFYRNPAQLLFLYDYLLPELFERKCLSGSHLLRIWSAGCSTGEEPYSIAHLLSAYNELRQGCEVQIIAGDINRRNLDWAEKGVYRRRSIRSQVRKVEKMLDRPLGSDLEDGRFRVDPRLREMIEFRFQNLHDLESLKSLWGSDIIFCRNVLIYFDETFKKRLVQMFFHLLNPGGMLFLGETESLNGIEQGFKLVSCNGAYGYKKE